VNLVATAPLPMVAAALALIFVIAGEIGFVAHRRLGNRADGNANDEGQVLSTALLLLALLLGFTFSIALNRYDARRIEVVAEANDIGTAWLRAGLADNDAGRNLQAKLADYARTRVRGSDDDAAYTQLKARGAVLRRDIWRLAAAATMPDRSTAQAASLVAAVNAVLDRATSREAAIEARVPGQVIIMLIVYAAASAFLLGYVLGAHGRRHRLASLLLFVLLALTITLILDIDRPHSGGIQISQAPLVDLIADIGAPVAP